MTSLFMMEEMAPLSRLRRVLDRQEECEEEMGRDAAVNGPHLGDVTGEGVWQNLLAFVREDHRDTNWSLPAPNVRQISQCFCVVCCEMFRREPVSSTADELFDVISKVGDWLQFTESDIRDVCTSIVGISCFEWLESAFELIRLMIHNAWYAFLLWESQTRMLVTCLVTWYNQDVRLRKPVLLTVHRFVSQAGRKCSHIGSRTLYELETICLHGCLVDENGEGMLPEGLRALCTIMEYDLDLAEDLSHGQSIFELLCEQFSSYSFRAKIHAVKVMSILLRFIDIRSMAPIRGDFLDCLLEIIPSANSEVMSICFDIFAALMPTTTTEDWPGDLRHSVDEACARLYETPGIFKHLEVLQALVHS